jgi:hypothetical protein
VVGLHPEYASKGEQMNPILSMLKYALDGLGRPLIKDTSTNGELRNIITDYFIC